MFVIVFIAMIDYTDPNIKNNYNTSVQKMKLVNELFRKISNQLKFNQDPIYKPERVNELKTLFVHQL